VQVHSLPTAGQQRRAGPVPVWRISASKLGRMGAEPPHGHKRGRAA
jgi:hypothetical protein